MLQHDLYLHAEKCVVVVLGLLELRIGARIFYDDMFLSCVVSLKKHVKHYLID